MYIHTVKGYSSSPTLDFWVLGQSPWGSRYYWGMVETGHFFVRGRTVDSEGGGAVIF